MKIYLIDDGTTRQNAIYKIQDYIGNYTDIIECKDRFQKGNYSFLDDADGVMIHTSFGEDKINNDDVQDLISYFWERNPTGFVVEFSNRFPISLKFDAANPQHLREINKDKFYQYLHFFLEKIKNGEQYNLSILGYGEDFLPEKYRIWARQIQNYVYNFDASPINPNDFEHLEKVLEIIEYTKGITYKDNFFLNWEENPKNKMDIITEIKSCIQLINS